MTSQWTAPTTERQVRVELAAAYRMAFDFGWTDLGATHFSARVPGENAYLLLESGLFFNEITASNLVKVSFDGTVPDGRDVNPAGVTIHSALQQARPHIAAVMHTHTPAGIAATNHPDGLLPLSQHALRFYNRQGVHTYEGVALDHDEGPRLVEHLGEHELLLLRNHGLITVGASIPQAFSALYYAEFSARVQVDTLATTSAPITPDRETCSFTAKQYDDGPGYQFRDWQSLMRQVERHHVDVWD